MNIPNFLSNLGEPPPYALPSRLPFHPTGPPKNNSGMRAPRSGAKRSRSLFNSGCAAAWRGEEKAILASDPAARSLALLRTQFSRRSLSDWMAPEEANSRLLRSHSWVAPIRLLGSS